MTRQSLVKRLRRALKGRVEEAYLVGSYARGEATSESDIDIILICPTRAPWPERGKQFADLWQTFGAADLMVYLPDEWRALSAAPTPFIAHAMQHAQRII